MKLRLLEYKDILGMLDWMHDPRVNQFFRFDARNMTEENAKDFVEKSWGTAKEKTDFHFAIVDDNDEYVGTVSLKDIDWDAKVAEYAISLRSCAQGKGIATFATRKVLEYAFEELGLNRVFLNVLADNEKAISLYEKCGFVYEGEFREHLYLGGKKKNLKWYSMLKKEYLI